MQVYVIQNIEEPALVYVGVSTNAGVRFRKHCSRTSRCVRLRRAMKRLGRRAFQLNIVADGLTEEQASDMEKELIAQLKSEGHELYNMTTGGAGAPSRYVRKETRRKLSQAMLNKHAQEVP